MYNDTGFGVAVSGAVFYSTTRPRIGSGLQREGVLFRNDLGSCLLWVGQLFV